MKKKNRILRIGIVIFLIPFFCLSEDIQNSIYSVSNYPSLNITNSLDTVVLYPRRQYSPDKSVYLKKKSQTFIDDSEVLASGYAVDLDSTNSNYQNKLKEFGDYLKKSLNEIVLHDSLNNCIDRIDYIFESSHVYWLKEWLIICNTSNILSSEFKNRSELIAYNLRSKMIKRFRANYITSIGQNEKEIFFIVDSSGYVENIPTKVGDIVAFDINGFCNITNDIKNKYMSKIPKINNEDLDILSRYIEYYNGYNIIFVNDYCNYKIRSNNLKIFSHLPKRFTFSNDSLFNLEGFYLSFIKPTIFLNNNYSVLLNSKIDKGHYDDIYLLNENGLQLFLQLSYLIKFRDINGYYLNSIIIIYYLSDHYAILTTNGFLENEYYKNVIIDIKQHKIIATPKIIEKWE